MGEQLNFRGVLKGHSGWVTCITAPLDHNADFIISASRGKSERIFEFRAASFQNGRMRDFILFSSVCLLGWFFFWRAHTYSQIRA